MVIYPESFSVKPNTESTVNLRNLFNTTAQTAVNKNLTLMTGNYVFCSKNAAEREIYISNTTAPQEYEKGAMPNLRKCAIVIENVKNMDIDCCGSNFIMDGEMTHLLIKNCENIRIKNLNIETVNPNVHKITVLKASAFYVTFKVDDTGKFAEENGACYWYGTDYKMNLTDFRNNSWMVTATQDNYNHTTRTMHPLHGVASIKPVSERVFNARFITPKDFEVGQVFYVYPAVRKEVGIVIDSSERITLENVKQTFNYGFGLVAQNSKDITLNGLDFSPNPNTDVELCSFADFLHFSMCRGKIKVTDSNFDGAGDDACNVHGINFKIVKAEKNKMTVKFCHPQAYGFDCIRDGDMIAFIDPKTLLDIATTKVIHAKLRDEYYYDLEIETYEPPMGVGGFVEILSANPDFEYSGNTVNRVVTRGVLATTRGRVRIENNRFLNTGMSGILISDDASEWYESGPVRDVVIRGNAFMNCEENAILIKPENRRYAGAVHQNILIENNLFVLNNICGVNVCNAENVTLKDNVYKGRPLNGRWVLARNTENLVVDCPK